MAGNITKIKKNMKKFFKALLVILISVIGILLIGVIVLRVKSPGRLDPLKDAGGKVIAGSLVEKNFIEIGGVRQGFFIRSENPENPVLLFLHGGPGSPELPYSIAYELSERLEKYFTVCYWEQRGAGMSFSNALDPATMNVGQMVEDARQMTAYLQHRFNREKIYLAGHSWGSYLGIKIIEKYPENYLAYIGIGQISNQLESERLAYDYMLKLATEKNDKNAITKLKRYDKNAPDFPDHDYLMAIRMIMNEYGIGMTHQNISMFQMVKNVMLFKGYTFSEKLNYTKGSLFSLQLFDEAMKDNLIETSASLDVPVYFTQGKYDYVTSYALAHEYLDKLEAPAKAFFTFENAAHAPNLEEPEKFIQTVREILRTTETKGDF
jgi:pimeloyl-ACP methyl ester carboxylesterase